MDIQEFISLMSEKEMYKRTATGKNMSLGEIVDALRKIASQQPLNRGMDREVVLEDRSGVAGIGSYRGYYSDLAIKPAGEKEAGLTVNALLDLLLKAVGEKFRGYKGGEYTMGRHTPMWVSEYGSASGLAVKSVELLDGRAVIKTQLVE